MKYYTTDTAPEIPHIHLNGTDAETLIHQHISANRAVERALELLLATEPHMRDYYTKPPGVGYISFDLAKRQHLKRLQLLTRVSRDLEHIITELRNQILDRGGEAE